MTKWLQQKWIFFFFRAAKKIHVPFTAHEQKINYGFWTQKGEEKDAIKKRKALKKKKAFKGDKTRREKKKNTHLKYRHSENKGVGVKTYLARAFLCIDIPPLDIFFSYDLCLSQVQQNFNYVS